MASGLFLLRGYNDIDYAAPILDRLLRERPFEVRAMFVDPFYDERGDTRLEYLRVQHGFSVEWLYDHASGATAALFRLIRAFVRSPLRRTSAGRRVNALLTLLWLRHAATADVPPLVERAIGETAPDFVALDHFANPLIERIVEELRQRGAKSVIVPSGTLTILNMIWHPSHVTKEAALPARAHRLADVMLFGTKYELARYDPAALPVHHIIGVPRYCDEWMRVSKTLRETNSAGFLNAGSRRLNQRIREGFQRAKARPAKLRVAYMATFADAGVWMDECIRAVRLIADFADVVIATKFKPSNHTPRAGAIIEAMTSRPNAFVVDGTVPSSALIDWADVVMVNLSSINLEVIQRDKPLWQLSYVHAAINVFDEYGVGWRMRCPDDLLVAVRKNLENPRYRPYSDDAVRTFERDFIHAGLPNGDVLGRTASVLADIAHRRAPMEPEQLAAGAATR